MIHLGFDHSYRRLPERFHAAQPPARALNVAHNPSQPPQTILLCHMFPGKVFGSELRVRKWE